MKNIKIVLVAVFAFLFTGCATTQPYDYSKLSSSNPKSILVLPPTNETNEVKASSAVLANSLTPLAEAGYYVFPPALVNDTFKHNGLTEPSEIANVPLDKLKKIFNADSVLYLNVTHYGSSYLVINSVTRVGIDAKLVDINSGEMLWDRKIVIQNDSSSGGGGLIGMLVSAVASQIINSASDASFKLSANASSVLFSSDCNICLLRGEYSPRFKQDSQLLKK